MIYGHHLYTIVMFDKHIITFVNYLLGINVKGNSLTLKYNNCLRHIHICYINKKKLTLRIERSGIRFKV